MSTRLLPPWLKDIVRYGRGGTVGVDLGQKV